MNVETIEHITTASLDQFWKAVNTWNDQPHVINRKLCGVLKLIFCKFVEPEYMENTVLLHTIKDVINETDITAISAPWIIDKLNSAGIKVMQLEEDSKIIEPGRYIYIKKLLPRVSDFYKPCLELVIKDTVSNTITFLGLIKTHRKQILSANFPYHLQYMQTNDQSKIWLVIESMGFTNLEQWLKKRVFSKIIKWAESAVVDGDCKPPGCGANPKSLLHLIDIMCFNKLYQHLKKKYGSEMLKIWPEVKNPQSFVCEDIAVAAYLLLLWEEERQENEVKQKQTFVDLKCGNGLLVYILNSEGHPGKGIDSMKRDIWSIYPETTKLEVQAITLSDDFLYPETDWLIGNQSDAHTAWIPIIAAKSSYKCKFFILPSSPYELNGQEYESIDSSRTQFEDYMHFLEDLCKVCGFVGSVDRLKIPSTKRTCLIGRERMYPEEDQKKIDEAIREYIQSRIKNKSEVKAGTSITCQNRSHSFQPVPVVGRTRIFTEPSNICKNRSDSIQPVPVVGRTRTFTEPSNTCGNRSDSIQPVPVVGRTRTSTEPSNTCENRSDSIQPIPVVKRTRNFTQLDQRLVEDILAIITEQVLVKKRLVTVTGSEGQERIWNAGGTCTLTELSKAIPKWKLKKLKSECGGLFVLLKSHCPIFHLNRQMVCMKIPKPFINPEQKLEKPCWYQWNHPEGCPLTQKDCIFQH